MLFDFVSSPVRTLVLNIPRSLNPSLSDGLLFLLSHLIFYPCMRMVSLDLQLNPYVTRMHQSLTLTPDALRARCIHLPSMALGAHHRCYPGLNACNAYVPSPLCHLRTPL